VILGQVLQNTLTAHPDLALGFGLYDFAASQNKKDEAAAPVKPNPHRTPAQLNKLCSGKCKSHTCDTQGFCIDDGCGAPIHCPEHTVRERQPQLCSGKCKPHTCDSQGFCIDDNCGAIIRSDMFKKRQRRAPYPGQPGSTDIGGGVGPSPSGPSGASTPDITTPSGNLPDNSDQSQLPTDNTNESTMPDDQSSQEQPFPARPPTSSRRVKTPAGQQQASTTPAPSTPSTPAITPSTGKLDNFKVDDDTNKSQYDWYLPSGNPNGDSHVQNPEAGYHMPKLTPLGNGVYNISNNNGVRYAISNGFDAKTISACTPTVQQRGYMQSSSDFKDIEMTAYYRINKLGGGTKHLSTMVITVGTAGCIGQCDVLKWVLEK
jgi:hypothetical protein